MPQVIDQYTRTDGYRVTVYAASNRGRNARGYTGAKRGWGGNAKSAKRAPRQGSHRMGNLPVLRVTGKYL